MQQNQQILSSREAAELVAVNNTTIQRAIQRGELAASRPRERAMFRIERDELYRWAGANGYTVPNANGERVNPQTGEIVEIEATRDGEIVAEAAPAEAPAKPAKAAKAAPVVSNVASVVLVDHVAADRLALLSKLVQAGQFDAAQLVVGMWA